MSKRKNLSQHAGTNRSQGSIYSGGIEVDPELFNSVGDTDSLRREKIDLEAKTREMELQLENSLVPLEDGSKQFMRFRLHRTGLEIPSDITDDEADTLGYFLSGLSDALQFWRGDWANLYIPTDATDQERSDIYAELSRRFGIAHGTIKNDAWVCRVIPASLRRDALTYSHHKEVAALPKPLKGREEEFIDEAIANKWSVRDLRMAIQAEAEGTTDAIINDIWLFDREQVPNSNRIFKLWSRARNHDINAKNELMRELDYIVEWVGSIKRSVHK